MEGPKSISNKKIFTRQFYFRLIFVSVLLAIIIGQIMYWGYSKINYLSNNQNTFIIRTIDSTLNDLMIKRLILPQNFSATISDSCNNELYNKIAEEVSIYLKTSSKKKLVGEVVPTFKFPSRNNNSQLYTLTDQQCSDLKNHLIYLSEKVSDAVDDTKKEIDLDIQRLNNWITIWIGVLSILGIFFPFAINYFTTKDIDKKLRVATIKSERAISQSSLAQKKSNTILTTLSQNNIEIENIKTELRTTNQIMNTLQDLTALERAVQVSNRFYLLQSEKNQFVELTFEKIESSFIKYKDLYNYKNNNYSLKSILDNFYYSIIQLVILCKEQSLFTPLSAFSDELKQIIDKEFDDKTIDSIITSLKSLNQKLIKI